MSAPDAAPPARDVPIDAEALRVAVRAAEDGIDVALETGDRVEFAELADWRRQLLAALRLFEPEDGD